MSAPVYIYWLIDTRPATIAAGWHSGYPFYCGKTVHAPEKRLQQHLCAAWRYPNKKLSKRLRSCFMGDNIRVDLMETVPPEADWEERERSWIRVLRFSFAEGNCNIADGGNCRPVWIKESPPSRRDALLRRWIKRRQAEHKEKLKKFPSSRIEQRKKIMAEAAIKVPILKAKREAARVKRQRARHNSAKM